ncbi:ABC transporter substrate-binding protein [Xinfangfangia sp. CPCC 101601]|uniref:ABC transporter substrate-binding protein n=1 Tax=Pseudogemmobacter lacusdianii TaxID=3069608 RepID=A0ABU0W287_9RHOB|nr:ABC transporter substrate-binding protein [Xinfangfangia sp. CPCC 101601]MDQ2068131.1 ABC transporter substrate-binding protein [Xinfangfangia sp. CPCC 101601]
MRVRQTPAAARLPRKFTLSASLILAMAAAAAPAMAEERALIIARDMDINSLDPQRAWCDTCQIYNTSVYEQLFTLDADNQLKPLLALSYEGNADQSEFTFKLNPDAKFSDGSPVEAKDVVWTYQRLKNIKGSASFVGETVASMEAPDAHTVVFKLVSSNSEFPALTSGQMSGILNSDVLIAQGAIADETAAEADAAEGWLMTNSAGSGPFVLGAYEPNAELRLVRNDAYWGTAPAVPEVIFRQVKDAVSQAQMLQSGSVDLAMQIDPDTLKTLEGSDVVIYNKPSFNFVYLTLSPGAKDNAVPLTPEVREAISLAVDRPSLIEFTLGGQGQPIAAPIPLGFPGGDGHTMPEFNPEKAKELLAAAGHPDGFTIKAVYPDLNVYGVDFNLAMQKIQQDLSKIGIKAELQPVPFPNWREQANGVGIPMSMVFFAPDFFGTSQYVDVFGLIEGSVWSNRATGSGEKVVNPNMAAVRDAALAAATPEEATAKWFEAGELMIADHVILPLVSPDIILAHAPDVKGVRYSACCNLPLAEISIGE